VEATNKLLYFTKAFCRNFVPQAFRGSIKDFKTTGHSGHGFIQRRFHFHDYFLQGLAPLKLITAPQVPQGVGELTGYGLNLVQTLSAVTQGHKNIIIVFEKRRHLVRANIQFVGQFL